MPPALQHLDLVAIGIRQEKEACLVFPEFQLFDWGWRKPACFNVGVEGLEVIDRKRYMTVCVAQVVRLCLVFVQRQLEFCRAFIVSQVDKRKGRKIEAVFFMEVKRVTIECK